MTAVLPKIQYLRASRKSADPVSNKKQFRGKTYRVNAAGLRGSSVFHSPISPDISMFSDPYEEGADRTKIGRYGKPGNGKAFPLLLMKAAHTVATELFNNPLDYSLSRRVNSEGVPRKIYSQRREAQAKVAATLIMHTHLEYGMVGKVGKNGQFYHMSLKEIASHSGVGVERCKRVMRTFREKGALKIGQQYEKKAGNIFEGHNSIRHLTKGFWAMFGFGKWMTAELKKRSKARKEQTSGNPATEDTKLLTQKWEPKREKIMAQMQMESTAEMYTKALKNALAD